MALDKAAGAMSGLNMNQPIEGLRGGNQFPTKPSAANDAAEFKKALERAAIPQAGPGAAGATAAPELKFSNHAIDRMRSRGIGFQPDELKNIAGAVSKAAAKGAKDTLILAGENALIVSVKNNTVVTVMDRAAMKDNVFTNIDSTVVI